MCGICGEIRFGGQLADVTSVVRMTATMASRGPDADGRGRAPRTGELWCVAVSRHDGVCAHCRRRRLSAGGTALPARLASQLVARCCAAGRRCNHSGDPLPRRPLAGLPGRTRWRDLYPDLGSYHRSRRSVGTANRPPDDRHRRADQLGWHSRGGSPDRRGRHRRILPDRSVRQELHCAG